MLNKKYGVGLVILVGGLIAVGLWLRPTNVPPERELPLYPAAVMTKDFYEQAFATATGVTPDPRMTAIVVNHHLLAPFLIAQAVARIATDEPVTVVLVSPDHFGRGRAPITSSAIARWDTPYGIVEPAMDIIVPLANTVDLYERPFPLEHGIFNVTGFIKHSLPNARIMPIIIKDNASTERTAALAEVVMRLKGRVIVIGSFDFTHESTMQQAQINDAKSIAILQAGDATQAEKIAVDSHAGIRFLMQYAELTKSHFTLLANSNSAVITGNHAQTDVTSYVTGYWAQ
jgi:AmmeMemoRadiSam system protein B